MSQQPLTRESILEDIREMFREREQRAEQRAEQERIRAEQERERERIRAKQERIRAKRARIKSDAAFDRQIKKLHQEIGQLTWRIAEIVERMVAGHIEEKFQALGYDVADCAQNYKFGSRRLGTRGEIDLYLVNGDVEVLIEVKTNLETTDVRDHIVRLEKFRRHIDGKGPNTKRLIGAVAGAVVKEEAMDFAHENGMYVIVQSGKAVEIVPVPEGFQAKEW